LRDRTQDDAVELTKRNWCRTPQRGVPTMRAR